MSKTYNANLWIDGEYRISQVKLAHDYHAIAAELASEREAGLSCFEQKVKLEGTLRTLILDYVSLLESGRDRIKMLGGDCDDVPTMEANDPALIRAKSALI